MLENFKTEQPILYHILSNEISNNKLSHAYLFDVSLTPDPMPFIYGFIKSILCPKKKLESCNSCNICQMVDDKTFPDIILIEPDGNMIKKEQLINLKDSFKTKSLYDNKKIYIIKYAENLNISSSNTILKFLEEPELNIIAILLTKNINDVITTVVSRCQNLRFMPEFNKNLSLKDKIGQVLLNDISDLENFYAGDIDEILKAVVDFAEYFEEHGLDIISHNVSMWFDIFPDKQSNTIAYSLLTLLYKDIINIKISRNLEYFDNYKDELSKIASKNSIEALSNKLRIIIDAGSRNKLNINLALNLDNMLIEMGNIK